MRRFALLTTVVLLLAPAGVHAQAPPDAVAEAGRVRFVGVGEVDPASLLTGADLRLLLATQEPATPNQVLERGVPFRASQIGRLERLGLLRLERTLLQSTVPLLSMERYARVRERLADSAVRIVEAVRPELTRLEQTLAADGQRDAFAALLNWVLRERVWRRLLEGRLVELQALVQQQQARYPGRGWWGVLWFVPEPHDPHTYRRIAGDDTVIHACWSAAADADIATLRAGAGSARLLGALRDSGRRVRRPETFPELLAAGVIDSEGGVLVPVWRWQPDQPESVAAAVEAVTTALAAAIGANLPSGELAGLTGVRTDAEAATLGYVELVPLLLENLLAQGFPLALAAAPGFAQQQGGSSGFSIPIGRQVVPEISMVVWQDLHERPAPIEIDWSGEDGIGRTPR